MEFLTTRDRAHNQARELLADEVLGDQLYHALCDKLAPLADAAQTLLLALRGTGVAINEREQFLHALQATLAVNNDAFTGEDYAKMLPGGVDVSAAILNTVAGMEREVCATS